MGSNGLQSKLLWNPNPIPDFWFLFCAPETQPNPNQSNLEMATAAGSPPRKRARASSLCAVISSGSPSSSAASFSAMQAVAHMGMIMRSTSSVVETFTPETFVNSMVLAMFHHCPIYAWKKDSLSSPIQVGHAKLRVTKSAEDSSPHAHLVIAISRSIITAHLAAKFTTMSRILVDKDLKIEENALMYCLVTTTRIAADNIFVPWMGFTLGLKSLREALAFYGALFADCRTQTAVWSRFHEYMLTTECRESVIPVWMRIDEAWNQFTSSTFGDKVPSFFPPLPQCSLLGSTEDEVLDDYAMIRPALITFPNYWCARCRKKAALTTLEGALRISVPALVRMFQHQAGLRWHRDERSGLLRVWGKRPLSVPFLRSTYVAFDQDDFECKDETDLFLKTCMFGCYLSRRWVLDGPNLPDGDAEERVNTMLLHDAVRPENIRKLTNQIESSFISPLVKYLETHMSMVPTAEIASTMHDGLWSVVVYLRFCNDQAIQTLCSPQPSSVFKLERIDTSAPIFSTDLSASSLSLSLVPVPMLVPGVKIFKRVPISTLGGSSCAPALPEESVLALLGRAIRPSCPTCGSAYKLAEGCTHVVCPECGHHFCHTCNRKFIRSRQPHNVPDMLALLESNRVQVADVIPNFALHPRWDRLFTYWKHKGVTTGLPTHDIRYQNPNRILHPSTASAYSHGFSKLDWAFGDCPLFVSSFLRGRGDDDDDDDDEDDDEDGSEFAHTASPYSMYAMCGRECSLSLGDDPSCVSNVSPYLVLGKMLNHVDGEETGEDGDRLARSGLALVFRLCNMLFRHAVCDPCTLDLSQQLNAGLEWMSAKGITNPDQFASHALTPESLFAFLHIRVSILRGSEVERGLPLWMHLLYTMAEMAHGVGTLCSQYSINSDTESPKSLLDPTIALGVIDSVCLPSCSSGGRMSSVDVSKIISFFLD